MPCLNNIICIDVAARSLMENLAGFVTVVSFSVNQSYISLGGACHLLPW